MLSDRITVVILAKNEEKSIAHVIKGVKNYVDNIIVVDGHSEDMTRNIAESLGVAVYLDNGKGKGDAIRKAVSFVKTDIIVFMDADMSHAAEDILRLTAHIISGEADHVFGSRITGGSEELSGDIPEIMRLIGNRIITFCINRRFDVQLTDSQNGFRAIKRDVVKQLDLRENITTIEQEMVIKTLKKKFRLVEIPTHEFARKYGSSKVILRKVWFKYIWCLIKNLYLQ